MPTPPKTLTHRAVGPWPNPLAEKSGFDILGLDIGRNVELSIAEAISGGAVFAERAHPLVIFRAALGASIRDIESHPRGCLFQRFLKDGPYERDGPTPRALAGQRLSDDEVESTITFIFSHMVNCFKGAVAELLACGPLSRLVDRLKTSGHLPSGARLYVGDAVSVLSPTDTTLRKGADFHVLAAAPRAGSQCHIELLGVAEVKSYPRLQERLRVQLNRHIKRAASGIRVRSTSWPAEASRLDVVQCRRPIRVAVVPSIWRLPRSFSFETTARGRVLHIDPGAPPPEGDRVKQIGSNEWRVTLRWSYEALAQAAYEMTFWYMGKVGEVIYTREMPKNWRGMTPAEAGRNSVKMMLYYAIPRCRSPHEAQRAVALYNAYCFGYVLGMNFQNAAGRREMLWPEDLDQIAATGRTQSGCRIRAQHSRRDAPLGVAAPEPVRAWRF